MITLNQDLVREYSKEVARQQPQGPYVAKFSSGEKQLRYVAAVHTHTERNSEGKVISRSKNPTLEIIKNQIAEYKPDFIIFEMPDRFNLSHSSHDPHKMRNPNYENTLISEPAYGSYLATKHSIPFSGAEPAEDKVVNAMVECGYQKHDIAYFYAFRYIPNITRNGEKAVDENVLREQVNKYLERQREELGFSASERLDYDGLKSWFDYHNRDSNLPLVKVHTGHGAPVQNGTFFQQISADIGKVREENINRILQGALNKYDKVMVVYGAGHLAQSLPVYEAAMGKAEYEISGQSISAQPNKTNSFELASKAMAVAAVGCVVAAVMTPFTLPLSLAALGLFGGRAYLQKEADKNIAGHSGAMANQAQTKSMTAGPAKQRAVQPQLAPSSQINYRNDFAQRYLQAKQQVAEKQR